LGSLPLIPALVIALLSFGFAVLTYRFIEQPFRRSTTPIPRLLLRYAAAAGVMLLPPILVHITGGFPQRYPVAAQVEETLDALKDDPCEAGPLTTYPPLHTPCVPPGQERAIALIGDSHAVDLVGALSPITANGGYRLIQIAKSGCAPSMNVPSPGFIGRPDLAKPCAQFNIKRLTYIVSDPTIKIVILAGRWTPWLPEKSQGSNAGALAEIDEVSSVPAPEAIKASLGKGLSDAVSQLLQSGKTVYLVRDRPAFLFNPALLVESRSIGPRNFLYELLVTPSQRIKGDRILSPISPQEEAARSALAKMADEFPGVHLIDSRANLCDHDLCQFARGDQTLYYDDNHLTPLGAQIALKGFQLP
jgi:hypothetical protein